VIYVHLKLKKKDVAAKILEKVLDEYKNEIEAFDLEELDNVISDSDNIVEARQVFKRGGSLSVTIPNSIRKYMNLQEKEYLLFIIRKEIGRVYLERALLKIVRDYNCRKVFK
jgi:hypothetical protein